MYLPALIGAGISLFLLRSTFFALFFLVPLGIAAFAYGYKAGWLSAFFAVSANTILLAVLAVSQDFPPAETAWNILYFGGMAFIFVWITSPPPFLAGKLSGAARLMAGSCLGALIFAGVFIHASRSPVFREYIDYLINTLIRAYRSSGADVVENAQAEMLSSSEVLEWITAVLLRGGALISGVLIFALSRQAGFFFARFFRRERDNPPEFSPGALTAFHAHPALIWVFSASLLLVVLARAAGLTIPEIILWNVLLFCAILYFAQGLGIVQFFLARPSVTPFMRLSLNVLFVLLLFSPFLNALLLGALVLLGAAENWAPFRARKQNGPPSTPEAGEGED